jgi:adenylate cyclase
MGSTIEIERKFIVQSEDWKEGNQGLLYCQGYLNTHKERTVRVRTIGENAFLTIKGLAVGACRREFEYEIPLEHANTMLDSLCEKPLIEKTRYKIPIEGHVWEVDEFHGSNKGLVMAEIELASEDEEFKHPEWLGREVTGDPKYFNSNLIANPFTTWVN